GALTRKPSEAAGRAHAGRAQPAPGAQAGFAGGSRARGLEHVQGDARRSEKPGADPEPRRRVCLARPVFLELVAAGARVGRVAAPLEAPPARERAQPVIRAEP